MDEKLRLDTTAFINRTEEIAKDIGVNLPDSGSVWSIFRWSFVTDVSLTQARDATFVLESTPQLLVASRQLKRENSPTERTHYSILRRNQAVYIGLLWSTLTTRLFCWLLFHKEPSLTLSISLYSMVSPLLRWTFNRISDILNQHPLPLKNVSRMNLTQWSNWIAV